MVEGVRGVLGGGDVIRGGVDIAEGMLEMRRCETMW